MEKDTKHFSFETDFSIIPFFAGGFTLSQRGKYDPVTKESGPNFNKAFTDFDDLVEFLIEQKKLFENPITSCKPVHSYGELKCADDPSNV